jgi:hypothetical protein
LSAQDLLTRQRQELIVLLARNLFEQMRTTLAAQNVTGSCARPWETLPPQARAGWIAAATYVEQFARRRTLITSYYPLEN